MENALKNISLFITATTSLALFFSVIYNSLFFSVFEFDFLFNLSASDYIATAVYVLPAYILAGGIISFIYCWMTYPLISKKEKLESWLTEKNLIFIDIGLNILGLFLLLVWSLYRPSDDPSFYIIFWLIAGPKTIELFSKYFSLNLVHYQRILITLFVMICINISMQGYNQAHKLIEEPKNVLIVTADGKARNYNYIRQLNGGLVVYDKQYLYILNSSDLKSIAFLKNKQQKKTSACEHFKICLVKTSQE